MIKKSIFHKKPGKDLFLRKIERIGLKSRTSLEIGACPSGTGYVFVALHSVW